MSLPPTVIRRVMRELAELRNTPPEGIRVVVDEDNMLDVTGIIQGPDGTPYAGGYFRVRFKFTEEFPAAPPKCWFQTKIFHPNVSSAGEICVNTLKKDWKSTYGIGHILVTVKCLLIYPNPESALDEEAGKLLLENYDSYCSRAKLITSVHATPRVRPAEFDTSEADSVSSSISSTSPVPPSASYKSSVPSETPLPTSKFTTLSVPSVTTNRKSTSPVPGKTSSPKSSSATKESPIIGSGKEKERHTSPAPLSTADANVVNGKIATQQIGTNTIGDRTQGQATKAVKRAAAGGVATGAEKRKKALKRL